MTERERYIHPLYEEQLERLKLAIPLPEEILSCCKEYEGKLKMPDLIGKTVRCSATQLPEVYEPVRELAEQAGIKTPSIFLYEDFYYGVEAKGIDAAHIEISAKTVTDLSPEAFRFLLAREICRIKHGMIRWTTVGNQVNTMLEQSGNFIGSDTINKTIGVAYAAWSRLAQYSADCYGYEVVRDIETCVRAILTLVLNNAELAKKIRIREYMQQMSDVYRRNDLVSRYTENDEKIPYAPLRIKTLLRYASVRNFQKEG